MNQDQKKRRLNTIKQAMISGREERVETRSILNHYLEDALPLRRGFVDIDTAVAAIKEAKGRGMLATAQGRKPDGKIGTVEVGRIKEREPYQKRPSVRALKRSKNKDRGGPSI